MSKQHRRRLTQTHAAPIAKAPRGSEPPPGANLMRPSADAVDRVSATPPALARKQCPTCGERYPSDFRVCPRDASALHDASDADSDALLGTILGDTYNVLRVIGEGAMGRVYEARHTRLLSKRFAIKVLHGDLTRQPDVVGRFLREAEATSALRHPNIVGVLDVNQVADGRPYIVAELLEGHELGDYLEKHGKLSVEEAVAICRPVCQALGAAHDKQIVHRDIKPENLFLVGEGAARTVKVLDFGISRVGGAAAKLTQTGMVMGTPAYMPPEQARATRVDHRADIYAVGAILYEAVTGRPAFDEEDPVSTLAAVLTRDPPRPCSIDPALPPGLELIIQKAMAKKPEERYRTMREFDLALADFDKPAAAPVTSSQTRRKERPAAQRERPSSPSKSLQMQLRRFWSSELPAPEQARAMLVALSIVAGCYMLAGLIDVSTSVVRFSRGGAPLSSSEIVLATLGSIGLLTAPILAWARFVIDQVWPSTPRTLDVLGRGKRVLATSLVTYAMGMLLVRLFDGAFHADTSGVAWPGWGLIIFLGAALTGGVSAWRASRFREFAD